MINQQSTSIGQIAVRALQLPDDATLIKSWVNQSYAEYWGMLDAGIEEVHDAYQQMLDNPHIEVYIGLIDSQPQFLLELYQPKYDVVGKVYDAAEGDLGMHILLAPCKVPVRHFSFEVMSYVMGFMFYHHKAKRIVVEPDVRNGKIHQLNKRVGFVHQRQVKLGEKDAYLAFCKPGDYEAALAVHQRQNNAGQLSAKAIALKPELASAQLNPKTWATINRLLLKKALAEFSHEKLLKPKPVSATSQWQRFEVAGDNGESVYSFEAEVLPLDHWLIKADSIEHRLNGQKAELAILPFILSFAQTLNIKKEMLATYLEELSGALLSSAWKLERNAPNARDLVEGDFQLYERTMSEGHPTFVANNGRMGFGVDDYHAYAPEVGAPVKLLWLAAHKDKMSFAACEGFEYQSLIESELDVSLRDRFNQIIRDKGLTPEDYQWIPVHPWQWQNKLVHVFAEEIAHHRLFCLGYSDDSYQAQQSIRTFYNLNHNSKHYVKVALSILNMGFVRGLSTYYMRTTPAINQWVYDLVHQDSFIQSTGFTVLREVAAGGYNIDLYDNDAVGDTPYKKMLAALWRESPGHLLKPGQKTMTMAALLHVDDDGNALVSELIAASGLAADVWLELYFNAYLVPLMHLFYRYKLVSMPHGENLILVMQNNIPVRAILKDIGEEVVLLNSDLTLPEDVQRMKVTVPPETEILSIFTDVFDCFFRYLSAILYEQMGFMPERFWQLVAECVHRYQKRHPELAELFAEHDLFAPEFTLSCLNRLQLGNHKQMLDLTDPAGSLQFAGNLQNPLYQYRKVEQAEVQTA